MAPRTLDPSEVIWRGDRCVYLVAAVPPPLISLPIRDFSHIQAELIDRFVPFIQNGIRYKALQRTTELRGPAEDIVEFRQLQRLRFDPRIRGLTAHAFAKYTTVYEAR